MDLQAKYIEALLSDSYEHEAPWYLDAGLVLFVAAGTILFDFALYFHGNSKLKEKSEVLIFLVSFVVFLISIVISYILFRLGYFTPIFFLAIPGIAIVLATTFVAFSIHSLASRRTSVKPA